MDGGDYKIAKRVRRTDLVSYWLPALAWSAVLLFISGNGGRGSNTTAILQFVLAHTIGPVSDATFAALHFGARKTIHVLAYALAGGLNFRAARGSRHGWTLRWSAMAVALAVAVAALDEWHQSYFASRTGTLSDVVIDTCGAVLAQIALRRITAAPYRAAER